MDRPEGVLALVDLGSALLSAEMALELLPAETRARVRLCPAPLVEGAIVAAVQSGLGSDLETVCREARKALEPKEAQLRNEKPGSPVELPRESTAKELPDAIPVQEIQLTLDNPHGLHARPAARFVRAAGRFNARVQVRDLSNGRGPVPANSLNALATLGAVHGHRLSITASGPEAIQALAALEGLVESQFGEQPGETGQAQPAVFSSPTQAESLQAIPVSEGIVVGPLHHYQPPPPLVPTHLGEDPKTEWDRLETARVTVHKAIQVRRKEVAAHLGEDQAAIFDAHLLILDDPLLLEEARQQIWTDQRNAAAAWHAGITALAKQYARLEDDYLKGRSGDLLDVGNQVLQALAGGTASEPLRLSEPAILLAEEITPNQVAQLDLEKALVGDPGWRSTPR
jgi:phosphocarrier protein FPr